MKQTITYIIGIIYLVFLFCITLMPVSQVSAHSENMSMNCDTVETDEIKTFNDIQDKEGHHCETCTTSKDVIQSTERKTVEWENNALELMTFISTTFILLEENKNVLTHSLSPPFSDPHPPFELESHKTIVLRR